MRNKAAYKLISNKNIAPISCMATNIEICQFLEKHKSINIAKIFLDICNQNRNYISLQDLNQITKFIPDFLMILAEKLDRSSEDVVTMIQNKQIVLDEIDRLFIPEIVYSS